MPSGKTHDLITVSLAIPTFAAVYSIAAALLPAGTAAAAFVFGGIMFGPDLDTVSRQYSRWGPFRFIWYPYRRFFPHRSRFSHGLIFGALFRVIYFLGAATLSIYLVVLAWALYSGASAPSPIALGAAWGAIGTFVRDRLGDYFPVYVFIGLWLGAASHTFTDMAGSFIRRGRITRFL